MSNSDIKLVGHRGLPQQYPENSIQGILAAYDAGADGVEIDVQASRDGIPVVFHDETLERVTGIPGKLSGYDFDLLTRFSAHEPARFGDQFLPCPITSLHDVSEALASAPEKKLFVEIKRDVFLSHDRDVFLGRVMQDLENLIQELVIISYDEEILRIARRDYNVPIGWVLTHYNAESQWQAQQLESDYLICNYKKFPPKEEQNLWQGPWQWFVYDVVDDELVGELGERGVNYIETWDVETLQAKLEVNTA